MNRRRPLTKGEQYRVLKPAKLCWSVPVAPWAREPQSRDLPIGAIITYIGTATGWGSDNIPHESFRYEDIVGEFWPNYWGWVQEGFLEAVDSDIEGQRESGEG